MDDAESAKRSFVCKGCGANLNFTPGLQSLKCEFCGTVSQLIADYDHIPDLEKVSFVVPMKAEEYQLQLSNTRISCGSNINWPEHYKLLGINVAAKELLLFLSNWSTCDMRPRSIIWVG